MMALGALFWTTTTGAAPPPVVTGDHNDPGYRRRHREPDWGTYRAEQRRLRETLVEVYETATGKVKTAEQIVDMPKPPKRVAVDIRPLVARLRELEVEEQTARLAWETDQLRAQDDEDLFIILMLQ